MLDPTEKNEKLMPLYPGLLPYGHTVGAPAFKPTEMGVIVSKSVQAMNEQLEIQKEQIIQQLELLKKQYADLEERRIISNLIYSAEIKFKPDPGHTYYLYSREDTSVFLTLIAPTEWNRSNVKYLATVKQLHDLTWQVTHRSNEFETKR